MISFQHLILRGLIQERLILLPGTKLGEKRAGTDVKVTVKHQ